MKSYQHGKKLRGSKNRSADEAIRKEKRTWDKYHTVEPEASPQYVLFPQRDEIKHTVTPVQVWSPTERDSGVHGVKKKLEERMESLHDAALASALWSIRVLAFPDWTPY